jgi:Zn finger protein HypA/HybF involved in hydrogenase expression
MTKAMRGAPVSVEYGAGYLIERWPDIAAITCVACGTRSWDEEDVDTRTCPRCGSHIDKSPLADDLIRGLWL